MFTELLPLIETRTLVILVSKLPTGNVRVVVTHKSSDPKASTTPSLCVEGTPAMLDAELPAALNEYSAKSLSLHDTMRKLDEDIKAAEEEKKAALEAARKAAKASKSSSSSKTDEKKEPAKSKPSASVPTEGTLDLGFVEPTPATA